MGKRALLFWIGLVVVWLWGMQREGIAGMVIEQVVRDQDKGPTSLSLYFSDLRFRTDHLEGGLTTILDFKEDRLVMIDHPSKNYVEVKLSEWEREVAKRLNQEAPGVKPKAKKIMVKKTGKTSVVNGFQTEQIEIWAEGELIEENWMTRDVEMKEIEQVMDRVVKGFSKEFRIEMKEGREIYEKLKPYGFPILIKDYTVTYGLGAVDRVEVKKIEKRELKKELFLPPAGYHKIILDPSKK